MLAVRAAVRDSREIALFTLGATGILPVLE
jgi:hypothetical protein